MRGSGAPRPSSSLPSSEWRPAESTRQPTNTSGSTCTPTPSCPVAPPCTPVSPTGCRRRSPPWLPPPSRSRSSLPPRGSTPSGSEDPSWPPCPPSSRCGSPSRSTTSAAPPSSTASASKHCVHPRHHLSSHSNNFNYNFAINITSIKLSPLVIVSTFSQKQNQTGNAKTL